MTDDEWIDDLARNGFTSAFPFEHGFTTSTAPASATSEATDIWAALDEAMDD